MEYLKINSLWKRQGWYFDEEKKKDPKFQNGRQSFIEGDYSLPEFANIKTWRVDEKVDGTNIRIMFDGENVRFGGRTERALIPCHLLDHLQTTFTVERFKKAFRDSNRVTLYGEGYGPKIQKCGSDYRNTAGFILFDALVAHWWMERESLEDIAKQFDIPVVPNLGIMTTDEIVSFVKSHPLSKCSQHEQVMEGVVCRPEPLMLCRNGKPIIFKLKCKEFDKEII